MRKVLLLAGLLCATSAFAETDGSFIVNGFPACRGKPVFSPYPSGAIDGPTAEKRAKWYARAKPIAGAPCVVPVPEAWFRQHPSLEAVVFCAGVECRIIPVE
jgi:hypothetical protein